MPPIREILVAIPLLLGTFLVLVSCIGLIRLPDIYCRMHAVGKAGTLGITCVIFAPLVFFLGTGESVALSVVLAIFFQLLTTPASTHLLSHASYIADYPRADDTVMDELHPFVAMRTRPTGHE